MMNKNICSVFLLNEPEPFTVIEPLNFSIGHDNILLSQILKDYRAYTILNVANWRVPFGQMVLTCREELP
ncbi:uncharacterized protein Dvar_58010 [Desulfosarcina variabilis str. Montpellier]